MSAELSKPRGIFFDWDGTLVNSFSFLEAAHNSVLVEFGMPPFEKDGFAMYFGKPREEIYPAIYGERAEEARGKFEEFVVENHKTLLEPMDDALLLLQTIQKTGIPAGVVSNKKAEFVNAEVDHFGWREFFVTVVGAREAANDKPSADPLLLALQRAGLEPAGADIWYVGDTVIDQKCAENASSPFIYIDHEDDPAHPVFSGKVDLRVKNCAELSDFLLQYVEN